MIIAAHSREIIMHTIFSGIGSPTQVLRDMEVPVREEVMAELKPTALAFCRANGLMPRCCYYTDAEPLISEGRGSCVQHDDTCPLPSARPDLVVAGFPCTPYSRARHHGRDPHDVRNHPDFENMLWTVRYFASVRPRMGLLENVCLCCSGMTRR